MDGKTAHENATKNVHSARRPGKEPDRSVKWLVWRDARTDLVVHWQRILWGGWAPANFRKYCVLLEQRWQDFSRRAPEIHTLLDQKFKLNDSFGTNDRVRIFNTSKISCLIRTELWETIEVLRQYYSLKCLQHNSWTDNGYLLGSVCWFRHSMIHGSIKHLWSFVFREQTELRQSQARLAEVRAIFLEQYTVWTQ
jgi:hypothetical protein